MIVEQSMIDRRSYTAYGPGSSRNLHELGFTEGLKQAYASVLQVTSRGFGDSRRKLEDNLAVRGKHPDQHCKYLRGKQRPPSPKNLKVGALTVAGRKPVRNSEHVPLPAHVSAISKRLIGDKGK